MNAKQERRVKDAEEIKSISDWVVAWLVGIGVPLVILAIVGAIVTVLLGIARWALSWGTVGG